MKNFFNNVYKVLIEKRTDFSGRASRSEYWSSWLFIQLTSIFLLIFALRARPLLLIFILFSILIIIPSFAVTVRRLHDVNKSGYWLIVPLPLIFISYLVKLNFNDDIIRLIYLHLNFQPQVIQFLF